MTWQPDRWPNFTEHEFSCKGSGRCEMDVAFMDKLQTLRDSFGKPMIITSGYRSPAYNAKVSSTGLTGPHTTGKACDVSVYGRDAYLLIQLAMKMNFTGIGINQRGAGRFVHLDNLAPPEFPRPALWTY